MKLSTLFISTLLVIWTTVSALAQESAGNISIDQSWARASIGAAKSGASYVTITNNGRDMDRLLNVSTPVSKKASLHTHVMDKDVMKMTRLNSIEIKPGGTLSMKPGKIHVMLMGLRKPLKKGSKFPMTVVFEKAGSMVIEVEVRGR